MLATAPMFLMALPQSAARDVRGTFQATYEASRGDVYRWALRFSGGRSGWAEDITHDVFVRLLEHLPRLEATQDLGGWLYRVTANVALSRLRRDRSLAARVGRFFTEEAEEQQGDSPDDGYALKEDAKAALAALRALPPKESMVLSMKVVDGKSQRDIADALGMSEGYVSKLVTRGWQLIREAGWEVPDGQA
jgi:RNA polymerase sigma-70 factor (ECF subfamily)